jgi:hypothetical protein
MDSNIRLRSLNEIITNSHNGFTRNFFIFTATYIIFDLIQICYIDRELLVKNKNFLLMKNKNTQINIDSSRWRKVLNYGFNTRNICETHYLLKELSQLSYPLEIEIYLDKSYNEKIFYETDLMSNELKSLNELNMIDYVDLLTVTIQLLEMIYFLKNKKIALLNITDENFFINTSTKKLYYWNFRKCILINRKIENISIDKDSLSVPPEIKEKDVLPSGYDITLIDSYSVGIILEKLLINIMPNTYNSNEKFNNTLINLISILKGDIILGNKTFDYFLEIMEIIASEIHYIKSLLNNN